MATKASKHQLAGLHGKKAAKQQPAAEKQAAAAKRKERPAPAIEVPGSWDTTKQGLLAVGLTTLVAAMLWAYWPTLVDLVDAWDRIPDYSHGYLVVPLALYFAWHRRASAPPLNIGFYWPGLLLLGLSFGIRYASALYYIDAMDGWSIPFFVAGAVWLLCGWRMLVFALPSIAFLIFMIPLPFKAETMLSLPLQRIATIVSSFALQCLGLPAIVEGNTILVNEGTFEVAQACSGLRIFVGIAALAFAYVVLTQRPWWQKVLLLLCVGPIAIVANSSRIVMTVLLHEWASAAVSDRFAHDVAGWVMIPYAALLFALVLFYLGWLFPMVPSLKVANIIRQQVRAKA